MPNTAVLAAAEGMPTLDRRRLLLGLAAASTAAAAITAAQPAPAAETAAKPELVALLAELREAKAEKDAAIDAREWLIDEWRHLWPLAPEEITLPGHNEWDSQREVDLAGRSIVRPGEKYARHLRGLENLTRLAESMAGYVEKARTEKNRARALAALANDRRNLRLGQEYYNEIERIKDASGIRAANARIDTAKEEIHRIGEALMAIPASSIACLTVKAEAVEIWVGTMFPFLHKETNFIGWSIHMARDIRNVMGGVS
ncbi:hypothetical protein C7I85_27955 [Mesorhizobium soli]|uniref:Uncharacterized protein n=2 Tax=Pseudaminobacter soli (ex Li et al. 2025) TaxID=1295366 RepID=A0A2P7RTU8_9HYPH|nr:hypothetical protein C7I85_27955 [Mesorhizobium soli]